MAKVRTYRVGYCLHPSCMVLKGSGMKSRCFPAHAYMIETKSGNYLWDTGYAEHFRTATAHGLYQLYRWATPVVFDETESLRTQLAAEGISSASIDTLILSHFHADHIAGMRDFPKARFLASMAGWNSIRNVKGWPALRRAFLPELIPSDIESRLGFIEASVELELPSELAPFRKAWDISGTGEILVVHLPGHAAGHLGAFVAADDGWILLATDAAWVHENYQKLIGPSELSFLIQHNRADYFRTLKSLNELHKRGTVDIRLSHQL